MSLLADVARRLTTRQVDVGVQALALSACIDDATFGRALDGQPPSEPEEGLTSRPTALVRLQSISVAGFRGIGDETVLELDSEPGLTLVVGNNGSGKSSFAEAVEFALTGDNRRWAKRSKVWRDGWRNLHRPDRAHVSAAFADGSASGPTVTRRWTASAKLEEHDLEVLGAADLDALGWTQALDLYRPFLPYSELGALVDDGPTALHDTLSSVLGLDVLTAGAKRLQSERLDRQRTWKDVVATASSLADEVDSVDDPRSSEVAALLRSKAPDPDAVAEFAGEGRHELDPAMDVLRVLVGLPGPDLDAVRRATDAIDDAVDAVRNLAGTDAARDVEVADLLRAALAFHRTHGDADCPVCGTGALDPPWADRAGRVEAELRQGASAIDQAQAVLDAARRVLSALATDPPVVLTRAGLADIDASLASEAWDDLAATRSIEDDRERAVQVRRRAEAVSAALADLRTRSKLALADRSDEWTPVARRLGAWVNSARSARDAGALVSDLKEAEAAVNAVLDEIRAERWEPIAAQARTVWERLGQGSSVAIEDVALTGTGTRRRVEVAVTVDGIEGAALGVMSQGELHALALSLFLPRACLPESPFGFIVIDDPVQSMDSLRVDGLARVLADAAQDRQIVVFTHDERLREAVHAAGVPATIVEVHRGERSAVELRRSIA